MPTAAEEAALGTSPAAADRAGAASAGEAAAVPEPGPGEAAVVARAYFEAVAAKDLDAMTALWQPGAMDELHGLASLRAPEGIRDWFENTFRAVPDLRMVVLDLIAGGDKVAVHWHMTGTFTGEARFEGAIATGEKIDITGCDVLTVREGRIQHNDAYVNGLQMARQLGLLPAQGSGQERAMVATVNARTRLTRRRRP